GSFPARDARTRGADVGGRRAARAPPYAARARRDRRLLARRARRSARRRNALRPGHARRGGRSLLPARAPRPRSGAAPPARAVGGAGAFAQPNLLAVK